MHVLVTGHLGYLGSVLVPMLLENGHSVVGLDSNLYAACAFGDPIPTVPVRQLDLRDVEVTDLGGLDAIVHLAGLSNDPLGDLNPALTQEINHAASVRLARLAKAAGVHRFVFSSVWDINYGKSLQNAVARALLRGYQLSIISTVQSGRPLAATVGGDPNGDTNTATDRTPYVGRNTYAGPNFASADVRFTRDIPLYRDRAVLRLMFEAFNVTNRANFNAITTAQYNFTAATRVFTPNAAFLARTSTFDPRILQLAAKITF